MIARLLSGLQPRMMSSPATRGSPISDLISVETSSGDVRHSKPCPDIFDAAVARLRTKDPREIIVVGYDSSPLHR